jgi:CRP-like cAMP-binding protein
MAHGDPSPVDRLVAKAVDHGPLRETDIEALRRVGFRTRSVAPLEDIVCQGDRPDRAVFVLSGMLARYHTVPSGDRQYLSLHIRGDMPDVQSLFLTEMDHSLCALDTAEIALFSHKELKAVCARQPEVAFALWRVTLIDAAIFRQALTNNSTREPAARFAHLCCELFIRSREQGLADGGSCSFPLTQAQLGQTLGMSLVTVSRTLNRLRSDRLLDVHNGRLQIFDWAGLCRLADFDPTYLHIAMAGS